MILLIKRVLIISTLVLSGCTSKKLLPAAKVDSIDSIPSVNVYVDAMAAHDIVGSTDGVYKQANQLLTSLVENDLNIMLSEHTNVNSISSSNGMMLLARSPKKIIKKSKVKNHRRLHVQSEQPDVDENLNLNDIESINLVIAENDRSTGDKYSIGFSSKTLEEFKLDSSQKTFQEIVIKGVQSGKRASSFDIDINQQLKSLDSRYIVFVHATSLDVSAEKSIGLGLLTAGLSGGVMFSAPISAGKVGVSLIDLQENKVLWYMYRRIRGIGAIQGKVRDIFAVLKKDLLNNHLISEQKAESLKKLNKDFNSVDQLKRALDNKIINENEYDNLKDHLYSNYKAELKELKKRKKGKQISEAMFDVLSTMKLLEYKGWRKPWLNFPI